MQQGTPAWFNARANKVTASRFGAAAGICPYTSRTRALRQVTNREEFKGNEACTWGTKHEQVARLAYMVRTGNEVKSEGFVLHPDYDWLGGSPDGLVGERGMIEIKCPYYRMQPHEKIPPVYYCQMNGLMEILDRDWCDFVSWTPTEMRIYRVYRDPELFAFLLDHYTTFFAYMKRGADKLPNMRVGEKAMILGHIAQADESTRYDFWSYLDPGNLQGVWEGPFDDPFEDIEDSSKRQRTDGADEDRELPEASAAGDEQQRHSSGTV